LHSPHVQQAVCRDSTAPLKLVPFGPPVVKAIRHLLAYPLHAYLMVDHFQVLPSAAKYQAGRINLQSMYTRKSPINSRTSHIHPDCHSALNTSSSRLTVYASPSSVLKYYPSLQKILRFDEKCGLPWYAWQPARHRKQIALLPKREYTLVRLNCLAVLPAHFSLTAMRSFEQIS